MHRFPQITRGVQQVEDFHPWRVAQGRGGGVPRGRSPFHRRRPGVLVVGIAAAVAQALGIGEGKCALLLGVNFYGLSIRTVGFPLPEIALRWRSHPDMRLRSTHNPRYSLNARVLSASA